MRRWIWSVIETVNVILTDAKQSIGQYDWVYFSITIRVYWNLSQHLFYIRWTNVMCFQPFWTIETVKNSALFIIILQEI